HGRWLFVHNGLVNDFHAIRRDLLMALDSESVAEIQGSTDSEVVFHLALSYGLEQDPIAAVESALGHVEEALRRHGIEPALQASIGVSDGERIWAVRYASADRPRTLFTSADVDALRKLDPENPRLQMLREGDRVIVSEPFADLPGAWHEIPESMALIVDAEGGHETRPFRPKVAIQARA
ncbi:MAG TPA: hypothetical protein VF752_17645, partial [Thermoleophilaceae bacterium]